MDTSPDKKSVPPNLPGAEVPEPEKYIRTFASDMEILKKGGVPQLQPLIATPPQALEPEPAPLAEVVAEVVTPPNPPMPPPPLVAKPVFVPPPIAKSSPPPPPPVPRSVSTPEINTSPLQTYTSDFLQKVKDTHASTATVIAAEQDANGSRPAVVAKTPALSIVSITAGVLLLLLGGGGVYLGYARYVTKTIPTVLEKKVSTPIVVNESESLSGADAKAIQAAIAASVVRTLPVNSVRFLYTDSATTTGNSVFSVLHYPAPDVLLRNIIAARSMAGVINVAGASSPFFILSVTSYSDTFAGMLSWETTILRDVSTLFPAYPEVVHAPSLPVVATSTATTTLAKKASNTNTNTNTKVAATSTPPTLPQPPAPILTFRDEVVSNHDVRVYRDTEGRSILVYGYWNKSTLVIARDLAVFAEIIRRLATAP